MKILTNKVEAYFEKQYPQDEPGATVLIMKNDTVVFTKSWGIADMEKMTPIDEHTSFNIASVSKQFSAVALMMLAEEDKLSLNDNLQKWFPSFKADFFKRITLKHLLSHTSGIPDSRDRRDRDFVLRSTDEESYAYIADLKSLSFEPGTAYEYMNPTYQLMYTIIELASGVSFEKFMHDRIFIPSAMTETLYFEENRVIPHMAHGYLWDKEAGVYNEYDYGEESFFATKADGGIYTTVPEFVKWEKALRNNILINEESLHEAQSPKVTIPEIPNNSYGYGWFIEEREGYPTKIYHTGDNGGFQIYAARYPAEKVLILIFSNRNDRDRETNAYKLDEFIKEAGLL